MTIGDLRRAIAGLPAEMPVYVLQDENHEIWEASRAVMVDDYFSETDSDDTARKVATWERQPFESGEKPNGLLIDFLG